MAWLPLESNPEVLNPFARQLGLPEDWGFVDVFGLDEELLAMVPTPCTAVCLLHPSEGISAPRLAELRAKRASLPAVSERLFFTQQHDGCGNACGTIASMHALANGAAAGAFALAAESPLADFARATAGLDPAARGRELIKATALHSLSNETAANGETEGAGTDDAQDQHFIAFVALEGSLYELDGRKVGENGQAFAVNHGPLTSPDSFLSDAARVIREDFMTRTTSLNFNVVALSKLP